MGKRFMSIWFPYLLTDWWIRRKPLLSQVPFVLVTPDHGRLIVTDVNKKTQHAGIYAGMVLADAKAIAPEIEAIHLQPEVHQQLLHRMAQWCIRFTPVAAIDMPDGLLLDISGCAHLWDGEEKYLLAIRQRFELFGYTVRLSIADTIGAAWAVSRYGHHAKIGEPGKQQLALLDLPPAALRLERETIEKLTNVGLDKIAYLINMPRSALRRRFGEALILRLKQALGETEEMIEPVILPVIYQERLPCLEPISTAKGISIALEKLITVICTRLQKEEIGLRKCIFKAYRIDGKIEQVQIGTNRATHNTIHLLKLFEEKITSIEPDLGIELFILEAPVVEKVNSIQEKLWENSGGLQQNKVVQLLDRIAGKFGADTIYRYLPDEHYWPERSVKRTASFTQQPSTSWNSGTLRPLYLLAVPELIQVMAPIPDYPPKLFRYKGKVHHVKKADGPERIEHEWWLEHGRHRDYYAVEDDEGKRYWLFRLGHYEQQEPPQWFIHGFFA